MDHADIDHTGLTGCGGAAPVFGSAAITHATLTSSGSFADVTDASVTLTTLARRLKITWVGIIQYDASATWISLGLNLDGTDVESAHDLLIMGGAGTTPYLSFSITYMTAVLTAASHTVKGRVRRSAGSTANSGIAQAAGSPGFLYVEETPLTV